MNIAEKIDSPDVRSSPQNQSKFYSRYWWCLNPFLTFSDLLERTAEELGRYESLGHEWQREESRVSLHIFASAMSCTVDDYILLPRFLLAQLGSVFAALAPIVPPLEAIANSPSAFRSAARTRGLRDWKPKLDLFVEETCRLLIGGDRTDEVQISRMKSQLQELVSDPLPEPLISSRMKLNEGYRCQDLTYRDIITLAQRYLETGPDALSRQIIVGARTAGSYFAPLLKVYLESRGFADVNWLTIRPKYGPRAGEREKLLKLLRPDATVILIDDYSNTGRTFRLMEEIICRLGVDRSRIVILAPIHPARAALFPRTKPSHEGDSTANTLTSSTSTRVITIEHGDLYLKQSLEPGPVVTSLGHFTIDDDQASVMPVDTIWALATNAEFERHYADNYQVRLKRVYEFSVTKTDGTEIRRKVLVKSVGQGWLGYHTHFAGERLQGYVPRVYGIEGGLAFMEWIDGMPAQTKEITDASLKSIAGYIARRGESLRLREDPRSNPPFLGWGWLEILSMLRRAYHPIFGRLKDATLLKRLKKSLRSKPVFIDGRMKPTEWIATPSEMLKIDFEHHTFGAPELDITDPAYDLAATIFEFKLSAADEHCLVSEYSRLSGDVESLGNRIFLHKLLYGTSEADRAFHRLRPGRNQTGDDELNERILGTWNFRTFTMNNYVSGLLKKTEWSSGQSGVLFMDIDGVFDREVFGFPHTSIDGLHAISILRSNGYRIVPNTGRSLAHVRDYCRNYGFSDGIAEYGSVVVQQSGDISVPLIDSETDKVISRCRDLVRQIPGVFVDSSYRFAVRAFRYGPNGTIGLGEAEANELLDKNHITNLKVIARRNDTYFVGKCVDKGTAISMYLELMGCEPTATFAIGDSREDIPMLEAAKIGFVPANCSAVVRSLTRKGKLILLRRGYQSGLLEAAELILGRKAGRRDQFIKEFDEASFEMILIRLLEIADYSSGKRVLALLRSDRLG